MGCLKLRRHVVISLLLAIVVAADCATGGALTIFNVLRYGAAGNGRSDDSPAFLRAWEAACKGNPTKNIPVVYVPPNRTFLLTPLAFLGPCKSQRIYVLMSGKLIAPVKREWKGSPDAWIQFFGINGLVMKGKGVIDGQGSTWWPDNTCRNDPDPAKGVACKGPYGMMFRNCDGLRLKGFSKINGPGSHIKITKANNTVISNLWIIAPGDSPNTDGIDITSSTDVQIRNSFIATGDDCVAINAGTSNVYVTGITCGPGHGISIGSLGHGGGNDTVENVHVRNCTLKGTLTGVRIKTVQGGKGYARNISFKGIKFEAVDNPIQIEQFYCPLKVNCRNYTSAIAVSDVSFVGISGTSVAQNVINLNCNQLFGCKNIRLDRVYIQPSIAGNKVSATCNNAHGKATHTRPMVNCFLP
ncbi:probable polygalacturonase At3g15720 [Andrographis paniculata]|uniref:probable polygalacturonase At3g15720 n=1 Tax=Andrographis paniculata TaxID=175694 RepID=UPI0021E8C1F7|nr:probable polygalacturonase At3g15720 [Andrographis paniculata]